VFWQFVSTGGGGQTKSSGRTCIAYLIPLQLECGQHTIGFQHPCHRTRPLVPHTVGRHAQCGKLAVIPHPTSQKHYSLIVPAINDVIPLEGRVEKSTSDDYAVMITCTTTSPRCTMRCNSTSTTVMPAVSAYHQKTLLDVSALKTSTMQLARIHRQLFQRAVHLQCVCDCPRS
jgi:hypothetical protein